ncbi:MAG: peptidase S8 [Flavobacteriaceae bacterium]|nr:peptidase S8 [Flavobacteriaceae bacterium]
MDLRNDSIAGMSVARAHAELIKDQKGEKVIVAVIDSGVDIEHPLLQEVVWINRGEVPNNNIDDDNNGFVDDLHGWNFLGAANLENMESVRLQKKEKPDSEAYKNFEEKRLNNLESKKHEVVSVQDMLAQIKESDSVIKSTLKKENYTLEEVESYSPKTFALMEALIFKRFLEENLLTASKLEIYLERAQAGINAHYNIAFDGRKVVGDDPDDINDTQYGNPNVIGPDKEAANHGTHVSGIIAAIQNNNPGNKSDFEGVEIMVLRAVPDGDEYDKDIALAIRYAVDNGAKIINTSFGKGYSPHKDWVWAAVRHAEKNDVLIINAAGNSAKNIDPGMEKTYITDEENETELFSNLLTVGAADYSYNEEQVASFSNFGGVNVDVFAPGDKIWSIVPNEEYDFYSGTSMAAPNAAGVATIIRSFFPKLKAFQVKRILMDSGLPMYPSLKSPEGETLVNPRSLSASGKTINLYNALIYASSKSYKK